MGRVGGVRSIDGRTNAERLRTADRPGRSAYRLADVNRERINRDFHDRYRHDGKRPFRHGWSGWHASHWPGGEWLHYHHWYYGGYRPGYWWRCATPIALTGWIVYPWLDPIYYDYGYGGNVYYSDDIVYIDKRPVCSGLQYYQEAYAIADSVPEIDEQWAEEIEWLPLGVFAVVDEELEDGKQLLQLAVSKEGIIAGTLYNEKTGVVRPVEGTVDKDTQRAAWSFVDSKDSDVVMETGIYNLTKDKTKILVHLGPDITKTWTLVRLDEESENGTPEGIKAPAPNP
ncbi:MAG: hypothetical protein JXM70_02895 [Pirellulales bacterium]|nr:hypothetical protein [Pirellulales bacterium]